MYIENPRVLDKLAKRPNLSRTETLDSMFAPNAESMESGGYYDEMLSAYLQNLITTQFTNEGEGALIELKSDSTTTQLEQYTRNVKSLEEKIDEIVGG